MIRFLTKRYEATQIKVRLFLFLVDVIGGILFLPLKMSKNRGRKLIRENIRNILILRLDGVGDVVISSAALREIRRGFPDAKITLLVGPWSAEIAKCIPYYDQLIVHNCFLFGIFRGTRKLNVRNELKLMKELRNQNFDLGIDLRGDLLSIIPLFLSGAKYRVAKCTRGGGFLLTHVVRWEKERHPHEKDKALRLVEVLGVKVQNRDMELKVPDRDLTFIERYLKNKRINSCDLLVTMAPCALYFWRSWRSERFAEAASLFAKKFQCKVVLLGSSKDQKTLERIKNSTYPTPVNAGGDLTLSQVAGMISRSNIFIGNDSGLIHIAAAVNTPMIQIFGPGEAEKFGYANSRNIVLKSNECVYHPCDQRSCQRKDDWCMDRISIGDVVRAFEKIMYVNFTKRTL